MPARTHEVDLKPVCLVLPMRSLRSTSFHPELRSLRHDKPFLLSVRATFDSNDSMGVRVLGLVCSPPPPGLFHILGSRTPRLLAQALRNAAGRRILEVVSPGRAINDLELNRDRIRDPRAL